MISAKLHERISNAIKRLQRHADRVWYPPLIGLLAALDNFLVIVPTDGILISSTMLTPKRWLGLALSIALGSTIGALALAALVELQGLPWILDLYPGIIETKSWTWTAEFFAKYGLFLVFGVAVTPLVQQPAVILAALANTSLLKLAAVIFVGRFIKYLVMAYVGSHAPRLLSKMWGVKGELEEVGIKVDEPTSRGSNPP